jgi:hypothetical protein
LGLVLSAIACVAYAVGALYASQAPAARAFADGPVRMQPAGQTFVTTQGVLALQPPTGVSPGGAQLGPPVQLQPGPGGARLADAGAFGPVYRTGQGGFATGGLPLLVAAGAFALLSMGQFARMALASWRGELFTPQHGEDLRRLAWLALTIGLAHVSSVALQAVVSPHAPGASVVETLVASAAILASLFLFLFAHTVIEGARIADDQFHTV